MTKYTITLASTLFVSLIAVLPAVAHAVNTHAATEHEPAVIGAFPAPPVGNGPGKATVVPIEGHKLPYVVKFGEAGTPAGNSFYIADSGNVAFIPTDAGTTDVINIDSGKIVRSFNTIPGGRVAIVSADHELLFVLSDKSLAAYATKDGVLHFKVAFGGNAMVFNNDHSRLYVGGNMDDTIAEIDTSTGQILRQIPIGHSGDLAWANGFVFSANMQSGVMSVFDPVANQTYNLLTPEVDPNFTYKKILSATAGFMQLAVSPDQKYVYAAGFSGHILRFSSHNPAYLDQVFVGKSGINKLSGLAVLPDGLQAITTIENRNESVVVDLVDGNIVKSMPGVSSNRWILVSAD